MTRSVPYRFNGYFYQTRFVADGEYPIYARRKGAVAAPEEILLDGNALAEGHDYYSIGHYEVSPDNRMLAWAEDTNGRREYTIRFRDLATGKTLDDVLTGNQASLAWANDNRTLFYIEKDPVTLLGVRVRRHRLGTDPALDPVVWEEQDDSFYLSLSRSGDQQYILLHLAARWPTKSATWRRIAPTTTSPCCCRANAITNMTPIMPGIAGSSGRTGRPRIFA